MERSNPYSYGAKGDVRIYDKPRTKSIWAHRNILKERIDALVSGVTVHSNRKAKDKYYVKDSHGCEITYDVAIALGRAPRHSYRAGGYYLLVPTGYDPTVYVTSRLRFAIYGLGFESLGDPREAIKDQLARYLHAVRFWTHAEDFEEAHRKGQGASTAAAVLRAYSDHIEQDYPDIYAALVAEKLGEEDIEF